MLPSDWKNPDPILWKTRHIVFGQDSDDDGAIAGSYCPGYTRPDWRDLRFSVSDALENWPGPDRLAGHDPVRVSLHRGFHPLGSAGRVLK